ncbi:MAG TPA: DUF5682 family protein [Mycobacteriales bacterium]|nr:DUF5682 family protein [Mycobacteriales bacterium]
MTVRVLGVRHHGPGSARSVVAALSELRPSVVLIEGPPEADGLVALAADGQLVPPVALLAYATDDAARAAFWPFAVFSPEWQALRWALDHGAAVRFCDLPAAQILARDEPAGAAGEPPAENPDGPAGESVTSGPPDRHPGGGDGPEDGRRDGAAPEGGRPEGEPPEGLRPEGGAGPAGEGPDGEGPDGEGPGGGGPGGRGSDGGGAGGGWPEAAGGAEAPAGPGVRADPLAALAAAAGYDDPERWWDDVVESGRAGPDPFDAITEAMAELRAAEPARAPAERAHEARREAQMRTVLRRATREHERVAVVCGAWHAPALTGRLPPAGADAALLRGQPKRKVALTWVPWTHGRLATASGYGAGVRSPGWYHHLFMQPEQTVPRWLAAVAGVLRAEDLPVSTAHVIEAVRLADSLAVLRGRGLAGLAEVTEATRAVLADGDELLLDLVTRRLVVGEALGAVPAAAPTVPLQADLTAQARRLRLKIEPQDRSVELDLRKPIDLDRSRLLHRLDLLQIPWGVPAVSATRATGTFRETWTLGWQPELAVAVVTASTWGTTVEAAATAKLAAAADPAGSTSGGLAELTAAVERCLLADLPGALPALLTALDAAAAADLDVVHLMAALPALARALRYGDVRGTDVSALARVAGVLLVRICAGLPAATTGLDDEAAAALCRQVDETHAAVALLPAPAPSAPAPSVLGLPAPGLSGDGPSALAPSAPAPSVLGPSAPAPSAPAPSVLAPSVLAPSAPGLSVLGLPAPGLSGDGPSDDGPFDGGRFAAAAPGAGPAGELPARERWLAALHGLVDRAALPGLLAGRLVRLLLDAGRLDRADAGRRLARALSVGPVAPAKAAWVEGFLAGGGLLLTHDAGLLALLDEWITALPRDEFTDVLPLLRRTFSTFEVGERRVLAEQIRRGTGVPAAATSEVSDLDEVRAAAALPVVATLLGIPT